MHKKILIFLFLILSFFFSLTACKENHNQVDNEELKKGIIQALNQTNQAFLPVNLGPYQQGMESTPLVKALLNEKLIMPIVIPQKSTLNVTTYQPTEKGKIYFKSECNSWSVKKICVKMVKVGEPEVVDINRFKFETHDGIKSVKVNFTYFIKLASWFNQLVNNPKDPTFSEQKTLIELRFGTKEKPITSELSLFKKKEGWSKN